MAQPGEQPQGTNLSPLPEEQAVAAVASVEEVKKKPKLAIERVQTGVRIEKRMLKVLKALAEYNDQSLGELLEEIVLHPLKARGYMPLGLKQCNVSRN